MLFDEILKPMLIDEILKPMLFDEILKPMLFEFPTFVYSVITPAAVGWLSGYHSELKELVKLVKSFDVVKFHHSLECMYVSKIPAVSIPITLITLYNHSWFILVSVHIMVCFCFYLR